MTQKSTQPLVDVYIKEHLQAHLSDDKYSGDATMAFEACKEDGTKYATAATPDRQRADMQDAVSAGIAKGMAVVDARRQLDPESTPFPVAWLVAVLAISWQVLQIGF